MRRSKSVSFALAAILGVAAAALITARMADRGGRVRGDRGERERGAQAPGREAGAATPLDAGRGGIAAPGAEAPGGDIAAQSARLMEVLEAIASSPDVTALRDLGAELQSLLLALRGKVDGRAKERLLSLLVTLPPDRAGMVGEAIGTMAGDVEMAGRLLSLFREHAGNEYMTSAVFSALERMQVRDVVPNLLGMIGEGYANEAMLVKLVWASGGREAAPPLMDLLGKPLGAGTREAIEEVLGACGEPAVLDAAAAALASASTDARASLVEILGLSGAERHAAAVREILVREDDGEVQRRALLALGRFGDRESVELLLKALDQGGALADLALLAMQEIRKPETLEMLAARWKGLTPRARLGVLSAAGSLPAPSREIQALAKEALADPEEAVRDHALRVLARPGNDAAVEAIADLTESSGSPAERVLGIEYLLRIGTRTAAQAARGLLGLLPEEARGAYDRRCTAILSAPAK